MTFLLPGKQLAQLHQRQTAQAVAAAVKAGRRAPGLGFILVGADPASQVYVANKKRAATACGFSVFEERLPEDCSLGQLEATIDALNQNPLVDGFLLQLPLPPALATETSRLLDRIDPAKDADGLHPYNQGLLCQNRPRLVPCTPAAVLFLVDVAAAGEVPADVQALPRCSLAGKHAVVLGRSVLVGKPLVQLLLSRDATVTTAHSKTARLEEYLRSADLVVAAIGKPEFVEGKSLKPGAVVIDVGINRLPDGRLVGDVHRDSAALVASAISPAPGGVGPLTVAMLLANCFKCYQASSN